MPDRVHASETNPQAGGPHERSNSKCGSRRTCTASFGINQLFFRPGTQASPLERPDQRLFTPECDRQRQPKGDAWSLDPGRPRKVWHCRLRSAANRTYTKNGWHLPTPAAITFTSSATKGPLKQEPLPSSSFPWGAAVEFRFQIRETAISDNGRIRS
jgi:hypothetical protein